MNKSKYIPKLRFPEFKDSPAWESKPLNSISSAVFDGTHQTPNYIASGVPFYSVENIVSGNKNKYISREDYVIATTKNKPEKGDVLVTRIGSIGFSKVVDWDYDFSIYVTLAVIKQSNSFNSFYLHYFIQSEKYQKEIFSKSLLSAVPCKINMESLRKTHVLLPREEEQEKIAKCLSSIDALITAQTDKIAALKEHKKGLMQKLFPQDGETTPLYRFPEFLNSPPWHEKLLSNIIHYENGKAHESEVVENGKYALVNSKFISTNGETRKYTNAGLCVANKNDILMVLSDVPNGQAIAKCFFVDKDNFYTVNQRICKLTTKQDVAKFLFYVLNRNDYFLGFDDGVKQTNLRKEDVLGFDILIPVDNVEQDKIVECLSSLDELISLHTEKLSALKDHKKGLMQQLFPAIGEE